MHNTVAPTMAMKLSDAPRINPSERHFVFRECERCLTIKKLPDAEFEIMKVIWTNDPPITTSIIFIERFHGNSFASLVAALYDGNKLKENDRKYKGGTVKIRFRYPVETKKNRG